jgi:hypothetical protein
MNAKCAICKENPAIGPCGVCRQNVCKVCEQEVPADAFSFREQVPLEFQQVHFCSPCFDAKLEPELLSYAATLEKARKVFVFHEGNAKPRSLIKMHNKGISVSRCLDHDETYLRLGFKAAEKGFNAVVHAHVERGSPRKFWQGKGIPAHINEKQQLRFED